MTKSVIIPLQYSTKPRRGRMALQIFKFMLLGAIVALCWLQVKPRLNKLKERVDARFQSFTVYRKCLQYSEPPANIAYNEETDNYPISVEDDANVTVTGWHVSRGDMVGSAKFVRSGPIVWPPPWGLQPHNGMDFLRSLFRTSHNYVLCARDSRNLR